MPVRLEAPFRAPGGQVSSGRSVVGAPVLITPRAAAWSARGVFRIVAAGRDRRTGLMVCRAVGQRQGTCERGSRGRGAGHGEGGWAGAFVGHSPSADRAYIVLRGFSGVSVYEPRARRRLGGPGCRAGAG